MFKEVLHIIPKLSGSDLNTMERNLGSRFGNIAKKFGKGLTSVLAGGGIAGLALGLIDKILNPLKETQDAIDKVLAQGDDIVTNAKQFGTTAGKLFRLQQMAASTGLDQGSLMVLLEKFQASLAEAKADPTKATSVRQYVGQTDTASAFFEFIQALQKMDKTQQVLVQQEIFGEKQILKMADFLQTDFTKQAKLLGGPSAETLTPALDKLGSLNDLKDALAASRTLKDVMEKASKINEDTVNAQDARAKIDLEKENKQIASYKDLAAIAQVSATTSNAVQNIYLEVAKLPRILEEHKTMTKKVSESRFNRGIAPVGGRER